jgi:hypothetical protein
LQPVNADPLGGYVTIQDLGSIGEFVASIVTLATLVYLAAQIRQNTAALRTQALQYVIDSKLAAFDGATAHGPDGDICRRGRESFDDLSLEEQQRFTFLVARLFTTCEYVFTSYRDGLVKAGTYEAAKRDILSEFDAPGVVEWWRSARSMFADDFQREVERLLSER